MKEKLEMILMITFFVAISLVTLAGLAWITKWFIIEIIEAIGRL